MKRQTRKKGLEGCGGSYLSGHLKGITKPPENSNQITNVPLNSAILIALLITPERSRFTLFTVAEIII